MSLLASVSRKRKRDEEKVLLGEPFEIHPHSSSVFESSIKIVPAVVLPRSCIPFTWLAGTPSRLFSAQIPALDIPGNILITKTDGERQLSVVEKVSERAYTLCKLSTDVRMKEVRWIAQQLKKSSITSTPNYVDLGKQRLEKDWWAGMVTLELGVHVTEKSDNPGLKLSMMHPGLTREVTTHEQAITTLPHSKQRPPSPQTESPLFREPSTTEMLEQTRAHYLETLYLTKTSVAYFAKSTLARIRVRFSNDSPEVTEKLIEYLRGMLLPLDKMDQKHKEGILQIAMEENVNDCSVFQAGEQEYLHKWVSLNFSDRTMQRNDSELKRQMEDLKTRETELQIILLLEILALMKDTASAGASPEVEHDKSSKKKAKKKRSKDKGSKKKSVAPDPNVLLELLLDRLCIWRSIGPSSLTTKEMERQKSASTAKQTEEDRLRQLYLEVIMPFYTSRLAETCAMIQKKFGVNTLTAGGLPGVTVKQAKLPFKRVRATGHSQPVAVLTRSNTEPTLTIEPKSRSQSVAPSELGKLIRKHVDLNAVHKKSLQKREISIPSLKPRASDVTNELKDAIKALSKPNRVAVASELMDAATRRLSGSEAPLRLRKSKKPVRNVAAATASNVLVMATPKKKAKHKPAPIPEVTFTNDDNDEDDETSLPLPQNMHSQPVSLGGTVIACSPLKPGYSAVGLIDPGTPSSVVIESSPVRRRPLPSQDAGSLLAGARKNLSFPAPMSKYEQPSPGLEDEETVVIESSPIKSTSWVARTRTPVTGSWNRSLGVKLAATRGLEGTRSCLFPSRSNEISAASTLFASSSSTRRRLWSPMGADEDTGSDGHESCGIQETPRKRRAVEDPFDCEEQRQSEPEDGRFTPLPATPQLPSPLLPQANPISRAVPVLKKSISMPAVGKYVKVNTRAAVEPETSIYESLGWDDDDYGL